MCKRKIEFWREKEEKKMSAVWKIEKRKREEGRDEERKLSYAENRKERERKEERRIRKKKSMRRKKKERRENVGFSTQYLKYPQYLHNFDNCILIPVFFR